MINNTHFLDETDANGLLPESDVGIHCYKSGDLLGHFVASR